jgi:hypothetical protein
MADERATPDEAKAMAVKAAEFMKANGVDAAVTAFNDPNGEFRDRDLYVIVEDNAVNVLAHPKEALRGKNMANLKDTDGKAFAAEIAAVQTEGWVEYKYQNPQTKVVEQKTTYVVRVGDYVVAVGAFKPL